MNAFLHARIEQNLETSAWALESALNAAQIASVRHAARLGKLLGELNNLRHLIEMEGMPLEPLPNHLRPPPVFS